MRGRERNSEIGPKVCFRLRRALPIGHSVLVEAAPLTRSQARALRLLGQRGSLTSRELARAMAVTRSYAGSLLGALERAELARGELIGGGQLRYALTGAGEHALA